MAKHHELVLEELREELAEVEAEQEALAEEHARITGAIALMAKRIEADGGSAAPGTLATMTMPDAVLSCLDTAGALNKRDLMVRLVRGGRVKTKGFSSHVGNTLDRLHDQGKVVRGDDARWRRAEAKTVMSAATSGAGRPGQRRQ